MEKILLVYRDEDKAKNKLWELKNKNYNDHVILCKFNKLYQLRGFDVDECLIQKQIIIDLFNQHYSKIDELNKIILPMVFLNDDKIKTWGD